MTKHGRSGHAIRSPRFRFLQKLEAQKTDRKDRSWIKDPKQSVEELFHPGKPRIGKALLEAYGTPAYAPPRRASVAFQRKSHGFYKNHG
ncbi:hypothetical protein [Bradyrhizobium centrolobii]|nr:hypothetical protein [Bradyrhizobium centrolobii]